MPWSECRSSGAAPGRIRCSDRDKPAREGLDLPEVSSGDFRCRQGRFSPFRALLIQTIGRTARNSAGRVIMYAEEVTPSMRRAIDETARRR